MSRSRRLILARQSSTHVRPPAQFPVPVLVVLLALLDDAELDELVPQPTALGSHLHATHAEPWGSRRHPAAGPQSVVASQPMRVQNHSSCPTSARQSGASGKALHSPPPGVQ